MTESIPTKRFGGIGAHTQSSKNRRVKTVPATIAVATAYAAFYQVTPFAGPPAALIICLFLLSPFVVCYTAYVILNYGEPSAHTFVEKFYDDLDDWRNGHPRVR